ncbi:hypothetical protein AVEN_8483-1 [Araneus ventricosus]|uniref:RNase H type-1 domain-containing protein n=1 Tax=Araneus ventricosus TaxID=182803 RepID=A0A4Y2IF48_ARAVE|nr:hypothetical protein AVEN_8483-1 [Araneus ventricosus]
MTTARAEKKEIQFTIPQNVRLSSPGISKLQQCHLTVVEKHSHEQLLKNPTSTPNAFHMKPAPGIVNPTIPIKSGLRAHPASTHLLFKIQQSTCTGYSKHPYINSPNIKLGWIKAHVGHAGNEAAELLSKKATLEEIRTHIQHPGATAKRKLLPCHIHLTLTERMGNVTARKVQLIFPKVKTSQLSGKDQKSCFQRDMDHSLLT